MMQSVGKMLLVAGSAFVLLGLLLMFLPKIPLLGKLPGDIRIEREGFSFYFPVTTCILLSVIFSLLLHIFQKK